jgi:hypothetical protein
MVRRCTKPPQHFYVLLLEPCEFERQRPSGGSALAAPGIHCSVWTVTPLLSRAVWCTGSCTLIARCDGGCQGCRNDDGGWRGRGRAAPACGVGGGLPNESSLLPFPPALRWQERRRRQGVGRRQGRRRCWQEMVRRCTKPQHFYVLLLEPCEFERQRSVWTVTPLLSRTVWCTGSR